MRKTYKISDSKPKEKRPLGKPKDAGLILKLILSYDDVGWPKIWSVRGSC